MQKKNYDEFNGNIAEMLPRILEIIAKWEDVNLFALLKGFF